MVFGSSFNQNAKTWMRQKHSELFSPGVESLRCLIKAGQAKAAN